MMNILIKGHENYSIDKTGIVKNILTRKVISTSKTRGYYIVHLWKSGKQYTIPVHRLVAIHFIPNPYDLPEVNHKDGNKENNHITNLEWVTRSKNISHSYDIGLRKRPIGNRKLNESQVAEIRNLKGKMKNKDIAKKYNIGYSTVIHILLGTRW